MLADLRNAVIASVRRRVGQGDCPTEPAHTVETLENVIIDLATPDAAASEAGEVGGALDKMIDAITADLLEGQRGNEDTYAWVRRIARAALTTQGGAEG